MYRGAFRADMKRYPAPYEQEQQRTGTSRSKNASKIVPDQFAETVCCITSLLNSYFSLSGFKSLLLLMYFCYGREFLSHCDEE